MNNLSIYILRLEDNKYYVGKTKNPSIRIDNHFNNRGSQWTKKYKPLKVLEVIEDCDDYDEDKYTIKTMAKYGIDNVRGGSFVRMELDESEINTILRMIDSSEDRCFYCGSKDHFIKECNIKKNVLHCHRCDRKGHVSNNCYAKRKADGSAIGSNCYRCGRSGHWKITCRETTDINGKILGSEDNLCIIM